MDQGAQVKRFRAPGIRRIPLAVRLPIVMAMFFLAGMTGTSHVTLIAMLGELERQVDRLGAIYMDAMSTVVSPSMAAGDMEGLHESLDRAMRLARSVHKRQLLALDVNQNVLAHIVRDEEADTAIPHATAELFRLRDDGASAWVGEAVWADGDIVGYLLAEIDISDIRARHTWLRWTMMVVDLLISLACALVGLFLMRRMLAPVRMLTERLRALALGDARVMPPEELPPPSTEFGPLMRSFNRLARAVQDREKLAAEMAEQDRSVALGKLAAAVAHEVRNPLAGMGNAVATIRRFGDDAQVREQSLSLLERGLESIGNVVSATLSTHRGAAGARLLNAEDLEDLRLLVAPEARRRRVRLSWNIAIREGAPVRATELRQILLNLLLNACAVTPAGGEVRFDAEQREQALVFVIEDQGGGMPPAVARSLEGQEEDAELPARGLGTRVVMRLVRELSGQVGVISSPEMGTRITLTIPIASE